MEEGTKVAVADDAAVAREVRKGNYLSSKRGPTEPFEAYKLRMKEVNRAIKAYLKGRLAWNPKLPIPVLKKNEDGTEFRDEAGKPVFIGEYNAGQYNKELHGEL